MTSPQLATELHGALIVNADDWGRECKTTDRILDCVRLGTVSSASAMVFMADSERASELSREHKVEVGLHLNLSTPFTSSNLHQKLTEHQHRVAGFLNQNPFNRILFHPCLVRSFEYVVAAQMEEFSRLYSVEPERIDGHHHLHLCSNVLLQKLLPAGTVVRRNFTFAPGEKSAANRYYRKAVDRFLSQHFRVVDYLYNIQPLEPAARLARIIATARHAIVELETHPIDMQEYKFLTAGEFVSLLGDVRVNSGFRAI